MNEVELIDKWIKAGANIEKGLRLFLKIRPQTRLARLCKLNPEVNQKAVISELLAIVGKQYAEFVRVPENNTPVSVRAIIPNVPKLREEWHFLSNIDCPMELKILASDKITAYYNYVSAHRQLTDCLTREECFNTAKMVVINFLENRSILKEFEFFKEHGKVLGEHRIFSEIKRMKDLRKSGAKELFRRKENLLESIWRVENEIKKGTKPHLFAERERRLREKKQLLDEVNKMIDEL